MKKTADKTWIPLGTAVRDLVAKLKVANGEIQGAIDRSPVEEKAAVAPQRANGGSASAGGSVPRGENSGAPDRREQSSGAPCKTSRQGEGVLQQKGIRIASSSAPVRTRRVEATFIGNAPPQDVASFDLV